MANGNNGSDILGGRVAEELEAEDLSGLFEGVLDEDKRRRLLPRYDLFQDRRHVYSCLVPLSSFSCCGSFFPWWCFVNVVDSWVLIPVGRVN